MAKSMIDSGMDPKDCCGDSAVASELAQGHPKSKPAPIGYGMRSRAGDGDGTDARDPSFEQGDKL